MTVSDTHRAFPSFSLYHHDHRTGFELWSHLLAEFRENFKNTL